MDIYTVLLNRPAPKRKWDQFLATPETVVERADLLFNLVSDTHARIAFLGDDDGTSLALGERLRHARIDVFEIDEQIIDFIKKRSSQLGLKINPLKHDLRSPIPKEFLSQYSLVFSDPPYTPQGAELFLTQAVSLLNRKAKPSPAVFLCYGYSLKSPERALPFQESITNYHLLIRAVWPDFNHYQGAESIGNSSCLYELLPTPRTKETVSIPYPSKVYTFET